LSKALVASSKNRKDARFLGGKKTWRHTAKKGYGYEQGCYVKGGFHGQCLALKNMEILDGI